MVDLPRKRLTAAARREELLQAASEVFGRDGYHGASLEDISGVAGVSKALIYEHFASKRELHAELVQAHSQEIFRRLQASADLHATGEERLRGGIDAFLGFVQEHRDAWRALFRDASDPEVNEEISRIRRQAAGVIAALMALDTREEPGATAEKRALFFEMHAQLLLGSIQVLAHWWTDHPEVPREIVVDRAMEFCWVGLDRISQGELIKRGQLRG